jgi:hypothetical protein
MGNTYKKFVCECGAEFDNSGSYGAHVRFCEVHKQHKENLKKQEESYEYVCACGRRFKTESSLKSHARFCDKYIHKNNRYVYVDGVRTYVGDSIYKISDDCYRCECGKEFDSPASLGAHMSHCEIHHDAVNIEKKKRPHEKDETGVGKMSGWDQKTEEEIKEYHIKGGKTYSERIENGEIEFYWVGKKHNEETKDKIRKSTTKYFLEHLNVKARYNKTACLFIDKLNEKYNLNLIHAENGGEKCVLGYFVDGYDEKNNIVFEYDEKRHYKDVYNNILKDKDINRQNEIIAKLGCRFFRYNETINLLYEVTLE